MFGVGACQRVEQLGTQCEEVIELLQKNIAIMEDTPLPDTQQVRPRPPARPPAHTRVRGK